MIKVETKYTYEGYKQYLWFSLFRGKYYRYGIATFPFFTALMVVNTVLSFTWLDSIFLMIVSPAAVAVCSVFYLKAFFVPKRYVKQSPVLFQSGMGFIFNEDSFSTVQTGGVASGTGVISYSGLMKVYETRDVFYVYIAPRQAFLLLKKDIVKGTPEELRGLLQSVLPEGKYIICK